MANTKMVYLKLDPKTRTVIREEAQKLGVSAAGLMRMFILEKLRERGVQV